MKSDDKKHGQYVRKVQEETHRYSQDLLVENERLRLRLAAAEAEAARLESRLREQLEAAQAEQRRHQSYQDDLERRLRLAEEDSQRFAQGYSDVERQNDNLANLYVASYRLHGTLDRQELVVAIQEILANLVGCEEMGVFELEPAAGVLRLVGSFGIEPDRYDAIPLGSGIIGSAVASEQVVIVPGDAAQRSPLEAGLTACIPLALEGKVSGVIAVFRLLSHKVGLAELDREIFDLLAAQAGPALYCTKLHAERRAGESAR